MPETLLFVIKKNPFKPIFQNIANSIRKILPTIFQRYFLLLATLIYLSNTSWQGAYWNSWTRDASVGRWTLDTGLWTLDSGCWTLDAWLWMLDPGRWTLDVGFWTLDSGLQTLDCGRTDCSRLNPRAWGKHLTSQLSWITAWLLVTRVCPVHLVDELVLVFYAYWWLS